MERNAFEPEPQRVPMDEINHFQRDERILEREPPKVFIGEFGAFAGECADENFFFAVPVVNLDVQFVARNFQFEIKAQIQR